MGFPGGSDGKEHTRNAGDLGLIPELGISPGGGQKAYLGFPVAQLVKNPPAMQETPVQIVNMKNSQIN